MKITWLTDIHLNFASEDIRGELYKKISKTAPDLIIISGDIAEATSFVDYLMEMADSVQIPLYFVLGNHDYYKGVVSEVRANASHLNELHPMLHYLSSMEPVELSRHIFLVGQDGWADARAGDIQKSSLMVNDTRLIDDFQRAFNSGLSIDEGLINLTKVMQELADIDAVALAEKLQKAIDLDAKNIHIVTHIPPFTASCVGEDLRLHGSDSIYPYFVSVVMGEVLTRFAKQHPEVQFAVYCGHTHDASTYSPESNLIVHCEGAKYKKPTIAREINIDPDLLEQNNRNPRMC